MRYGESNKDAMLPLVGGRKVPKMAWPHSLEQWLEPKWLRKATINIYIYMDVDLQPQLLDYVLYSCACLILGLLAPAVDGT